MFTGIVEAMGRVDSVRDEPGGRGLRIREPKIAAGLSVGDSVSVNGCCLTIVELADGSFEFQAGPETLQRTNLGNLRAGDQVNLERSMGADGRFGGHFVQGHVDGVGTIIRKTSTGEFVTMCFQIGEMAAELIPKGSIAVDGISLTVCELDASSFCVMLIPHTLSATTLGVKQPGDLVNIETDMIGKYVRRFLAQSTEGLTMAKLKAAGFGE